MFIISHFCLTNNQVSKVPKASARRQTDMAHDKGYTLEVLALLNPTTKSLATSLPTIE